MTNVISPGWTRTAPPAGQTPTPGDTGRHILKPETNNRRAPRRSVGLTTSLTPWHRERRTPLLFILSCINIVPLCLEVNSSAERFLPPKWRCVAQFTSAPPVVEAMAFNLAIPPESWCVSAGWAAVSGDNCGFIGS